MLGFLPRMPAVRTANKATRAAVGPDHRLARHRKDRLGRDLRGDLDAGERPDRQRPDGQVPDRPARPGRTRRSCSSTATSAIRRPDSRTRPATTTSSAGLRSAFPSRWRSSTQVTYFTARQALHRRLGAHLLPRRRHRTGLRPAVLSPGRDPRGHGARGGPAGHRSQDHHSRRPIRLRADRYAADHRHGGRRAGRARRRGAAAGPDPRVDPVPAAERRRGLGTPADLPAGQRRASADRHPGLRRAAARPLGGGRRADQGGAGHQLPRQPEVEGTQHPQRRAARRRAATTRGWRRSPTSRCIWSSAGTTSRSSRRRKRSSRRSWPSGWTGRWSSWAGSRRPSCARTTSWPSRHLRARRCAYARPGTARKAANIGFLAHREVLGRVGDAGSPSAERGYDLVPQGFAVPLQAYRDFVDHPPNSDIRELLDRSDRRRAGRELSPKHSPTGSRRCSTAFMAGSFPPGALERIRAKLDRGHSRGGEDQGPVQRQRRGRAQLRRRRAARQLRRRHRQAGPAHRALPDRERTRTGGERQAQGQTASRWAARSRASTPACGTSGPSRNARSPGSTRPTSPWGWPSCRRTTSSPRSPPTRWWSPGCSTPTRLRLLAVGAGWATTWSPTPTRAPTPRSPSPASSPTTSRPASPSPGSPSRCRTRRSGPSRCCRRRADAGAGGPGQAAWSGPTAGPSPTTTRDCDFVTSANDKAAALDLELKILENGQLVYKQIREFGGR